MQKYWNRLHHFEKIELNNKQKHRETENFYLYKSYLIEKQDNS